MSLDDMKRELDKRFQKLKGEKLSISGKCHTLTLEQYDILFALDRFAGMYKRQYADLLWLARGYQERTLTERKYRPTLLKESIDSARKILESLWNKGMVDRERLVLKTVDGVKLVRPKTKEEAFKAKEMWRISVAGSDCINPPAIVADCIKESILREEKETGKVTPMKAFKECWEKHES